MQYLVYKVKPGDTLAKLAKKYSTTVGGIARASGIVDVNKIAVGESLNIPYVAISEIPGDTPATPEQAKALQVVDWRAWTKPPKVYAVAAIAAALVFALVDKRRQ